MLLSQRANSKKQYTCFCLSESLELYHCDVNRWVYDTLGQFLLTVPNPGASAFPAGKWVLAQRLQDQKWSWEVNATIPSTTDLLPLLKSHCTTTIL